MDRAFAVAFGEALIALREERGITQEDLSEASEIHRTTISNWERGRRLPSLENLRTVAVAVGLTAPEVLERAEAQFAANTRKRRPAPRRGRGRPRKERGA